MANCGARPRAAPSSSDVQVLKGGGAEVSSVRCLAILHGVQPGRGRCRSRKLRPWLETLGAALSRASVGHGGANRLAAQMWALQARAPGSGGLVKPGVEGKEPIHRISSGSTRSCRCGRNRCPREGPRRSTTTDLPTSILERRLRGEISMGRISCRPQHNRLIHVRSGSS